MTKNTLLNIAILISRFLKASIIIATLVFTTLFVYVQFDKETFADKEIILSADPSIMRVSYIESTVWKEDTKDTDYDMKPYTLGKLKTISLYLNYFKLLIIAVLLFFILRSFQTIMLSVKTLKTFSTKNTKRFRQIAFSIVLITIFTSYNVLRFDNGEQKLTHISLTPVIYIILAFIMAEIFKEGEILREENDLTI
ncbi:DUF2975 domain-containing protein [Winogradskyella alexanderae]|uniref:DUF2975 domain-containing protein n=1 Tax=Winogradskyella alexanderae TaxID=2877123 RepID=A0ABS7XRG9_9FLAO|nr:DUF2975 domain-containing protein [Winogradskyella alexanderae]MCA0131441.1 DUF2975 domain-containing protein [Winogradskyella alexanderae]